MEAVAKLKSVPMSARKMRLVANVVRGRGVEDALNVLKYTKKEAAQWMEKTLLSAVANWEYKNDMAVSADDFDLYVKTLLVDEGTSLKRFQPAPHGRAHRILKRTHHLTVVVENRILLDKEGEDYVEEYDDEVELDEEEEVEVEEEEEVEEKIEE